jgi:hypothetical protein
MMYYCCSHGLGKNKDHTSPTCTFKKNGHINTATAYNMQGGSNQIGSRSPRRERPPSGVNSTVETTFAARYHSQCKKRHEQ